MPDRAGATVTAPSTIPLRGCRSTRPFVAWRCQTSGDRVAGGSWSASRQPAGGRRSPSAWRCSSRAPSSSRSTRPRRTCASPPRSSTAWWSPCRCSSRSPSCTRIPATGSAGCCSRPAWRSRLTTLASAQAPVLYSLGRVSIWLVVPILQLLLLTFPSGRIVESRDRRLLGAAGRPGGGPLSPDGAPGRPLSRSRRCGSAAAGLSRQRLRARAPRSRLREAAARGADRGADARRRRDAGAARPRRRPAAAPRALAGAS